MTAARVLARRDGSPLFVASLAFALSACGSSSGSTLRDAAPGASDSGGDAAPPAPDAGCSGLECDGVCVQAASCDFSVTSLDPAAGPMNGGNFVTLRGHGFAKGMRVDLADGRCVVRVIDSTTALIQPPPGPQEAVDVTITLGGVAAVLPGGYRYQSGTMGNTWEKKQMTSSRGNFPGLSVLQDGRALISGGILAAAGSPVASADLYDPATGNVSATAGHMSIARWTQASVTLMTGKVLIVGNWANWATDIVELFDPLATTFALSSSKMKTPRSAPQAVLLVDGRVLIGSAASPLLEIYDPEADTFSAAVGGPALTDANDYPMLTRLRDGRVLVVRGLHRPCFYFDSDTDSFAPAGPGPTITFGVETPLAGVRTVPNGRVFVFGGEQYANSNTTLTAASTIEVLDPNTATGGFSPLISSLTHPRSMAGTALLRNGVLIAIGGETGSRPVGSYCAQSVWTLTDTVDTIDPSSGAVSEFAALPEANFTLSVATLLDGSLIAAGGAPCGSGAAYPYLYFMKGTPIY